MLRKLTVSLAAVALALTACGGHTTHRTVVHHVVVVHHPAVVHHVVVHHVHHIVVHHH